MNVVKKEPRPLKYKSNVKNELVRKDASLGIRSSIIPGMSFNANITRGPVKTPRYLFNNGPTGPRTSMGPPGASPRSLKRKIVYSSSARPETLSSGTWRQVLASDSAVDTSKDFTTPRDRPTALRYISSSSRGGYSGTRSARSTSTSFVEPSVILAISEGRGMARGEIGMAAVDLRHPHLVLCQFSDTLLYTHTLTKINYFNPVEIIVPHTFWGDGKPSALCQLVREQRPHCCLTAVQRRHFDDAAARQQIRSLCAPQYNSVYLQVLHKFYALTAAAAVLKYVENIQCIVFARESLKIEYHSSENTMIIDVGTATQLELVQPLVPAAGPSCCLLGVLGPTYTVGGIRALRAALLQPSCGKVFIEARLDAVQELIESDGLMVDLQNVLKKLSEVDKILFLCVETTNTNTEKYGEAQITQTLLLKTTMDLVPHLVEALGKAESAQLRKIKTDLENPRYKEIADRIRNVIQEDAHAERGAMGSLQRCFAVKPEINGLLDVARRMYSELIEDIQKIVENLSETYDLPLRMNQNLMKGFHIVLPVAPKNRRQFNVEDLPPVFIQVVFNGAHVTMSTEELVVLDHQAKEALNEIQKMTNIVISALLKQLRPFMSSLYKLCENVAELDILLALAQASSVGSYVRPDFNSYLDVRNSVHPLLDYNSPVQPVPNDIFATPEHNFTIITGPNMGGKSIYIKQIAILQIMAQLGCFVPATNAVFRLCDRIFSRIGFNDSVELNASSYVYEMKEVQHILQDLTPTSLVIIDELCRSTSVEEGTSISWAICEELLASEAFTFFTTHFMYLTRLQELYFNVLNRHAVVTEVDDTQNQKKLIYQHKIEPGVNKIQHYGLALAAKTHLPQDTVNLAIELAELISRNRQVQQIRTPQRSDAAELYKLYADIQLERRRHSNADDLIRHMMQKFKRDHPELIARLVNESNSIQLGDAEKSSTADSSKQELVMDVDTSSPTSDDEDFCITNFIKATPKSPVHRYPKVTQITNYTPSSRSNVSLDSNCEDATDTNENRVTFSRELLNTVANIETLTHEQKSISVTSSPDDINDEFQDEAQHESDVSIGDNNNRNNDSVNGNVSSTVNNSDEDTEEHISFIELSDTSDELTQIIGSDDASTNSNSNIRNVSIDEELMTETVNEINEELMAVSVEHLILTPPSDFQDRFI